MTIVVTGGSGFVGTALTRTLSNSKVAENKIVLLDLIPPKSDLPPNVTFIPTDITDPMAVFDAFRSCDGGITCVFHVAGFGLAGTSNLPAFNGKTLKVNVHGTRNIIDACLQFNVQCLVFTSTVNVVFCGKEIIAGTEESHLWVNSAHLDYYSETKNQAEKLVIEANGKSNGQHTLKTCVLRLGGVYGPGEQTILGRSLKLMSTKLGFLSFCHRRDLKIDFLHIDNAVQGHLKAMEKLLNNSSAAQAEGQIFYITDGQPTNLYFFLDPLYSKINFKKKTCPRYPHIPKSLTVGFSMIFNGCSRLLGTKYKLPFWGFTFMESYKINVSHYFSIEKAREILDYQPKTITATDWKIILDSL